MREWLQKLVTDKNGSPNEHIVAAIWGSIALLCLTVYLVYSGHVPSLIEFGGAHGAIWGAAGAAQGFSKDS